MRTLALDLVTGDLAISNGRVQLVEGVDAVAQKLRMRLRLWQGEWHRDRRIGVPFQRFLGQKGAAPIAEATLRRAISTCPGVRALVEFSFTLDRSARAASVSFRATSIDGEPITVTDFVAGGV